MGHICFFLHILSWNIWLCTLIFHFVYYYNFLCLVLFIQLPCLSSWNILTYCRYTNPIFKITFENHCNYKTANIIKLTLQFVKNINIIILIRIIFYPISQSLQSKKRKYLIKHFVWLNNKFLLLFILYEPFPKV